MNVSQRVRWAVAAVVLGLSAATLAEEVVVKQPNGKLFATKSAFNKIADLDKGTKLQVIAREKPWIKVKAGDKEGWVGENSVGTSAGGDNSLSKGLGFLSGGGSGAGNSTASAGKGDLRALDLARTQGMSTAGFERMLALRQAVPPADCEQFARDGNVGPFKK
jgi:hypothetical protein